MYYSDKQIGKDYYLPEPINPVIINETEADASNPKKYRQWWDNETIFNELNQYYPIPYTSKINNSLFKHKICLNWERNGECPLADKCLFAHISFFIIINCYIFCFFLILCKVKLK